MGYDFLTFLALTAAALLIAAVVQQRRRLFPVSLVLIAVGLRVVGSTARHEVIVQLYGGLGDALSYYHRGLALLEDGLGLAEVLSPDFWVGDYRWWGTLFLIRLSAIVLSVIGPSIRGEFLVFALMAFGGLYAFAIAFRRLQPDAQAMRYAAWIWCWPSLWFWPSSIGKEAVLMLAVGLVTLGYVGKRGATQWTPLIGGLVLAFCVRPHVAGALALAVMAANWLGAWNEATPRRIAESLIAVLLAAFIMRSMMAGFGLGQADLEGVQEFIAYRGGQTLDGGSDIGVVPIADGNYLLGIANVLLRPFPWEAHNAMALVAGLEMTVLWIVAFTRRREVALALRHWRRHKLLRLAVPFVVGYSLMIGGTFGNMGIIARQRVLILPLLFAIVMAAPRRRPALRGAARRRSSTAAEQPLSPV